ncbi:hypothetical protein D3C72_1123770 [compost metagenome]
MPPTKVGRQYLEFVHVGKGGNDKGGTPGVSLATLSALEPFYNKLTSKKVRAVFGHKNYLWKENSVDRLPGWNFVTFPKHKSKIYTWLTEYEKYKGRTGFNRKFTRHPNQVHKIVGFEMQLSPADIKLYTQLCGKPKNGCFTLPGDNFFKFTKSKISKVNRVILATHDLKKMARKFEWDELTTYEGQAAIQITNPNKGMWDVVVIQGEKKTTSKKKTS